MKSDEKTQDIKIDIRSLECGCIDSAQTKDGAVSADYFDRLDYRFLFEHAYDAILLADGRGTVVAANARADDFFGYGAGGLAGRSLETLVAGVTPPLLREIQDVIAQERYMRIQTFAVRKGGARSAVEAVVMGNGSHSPEPVCYLVRDISERRRAEIAEQQAERSRAMAESLSAACHALGQPATVLLTSIEMLKLDDTLDAATRKEMVEMCYHAAIQLRERVRLLCAVRGKEPDGEEDTA